LIKELSKSASNLSSFLNEYNEFLPQVTEELGRAAVKLRSLKRKLSGTPKRSVGKVLEHIDRCEVSAQNEEQVRRTYIEIVKIVEELKENQKDLNWEL
jgi:ABC-type transporter Mla subunit MlaD